MQVEVAVTTNLKGIKALEKVIRNDFRYGRGRAVPLLLEWGRIYREWAQARFRIYSVGGGDWPPLKPATRRRKGHGKILRDTDTLLEAVGNADQHQKFQAYGLQVGLSGGIHPKAPMSIGRLAEIHQAGLGRVPRREIIVYPNQRVIDDIVDVTEETLVDIGNGKQ